jgi:hypothetical protein
MLGVTIRFDSYFKAEENLLHVIEVEPNSPAELAGLVPLKDFLLGESYYYYFIFLLLLLNFLKLLIIYFVIILLYYI